MSDTQTNPGPPTLSHVLGQKRAVQQLQVALSAHFNDRAATTEEIAFPHVLLVGPPGVGKSLLSQIISAELGSKLIEELGQNISTPGHLHGLMMLAEPGGVVFVDEIHETVPNVQTTLYRCLEERRLFLGGERGSVELPPFTFIGATTDEFALTKPLRDRFKIVLRLQHYSEAEIAELIMQRTTRLGWGISDEAIATIAARGRGTPRIAVRLLEATRRTARAEDASTITAQHVTQMCQTEGYDALGLDCVERRYLDILREAQGPVRLNVFGTLLGLPRRTIEAVVESDLIRLGLVSKTDQGRMLTAVGVKHLSETSKGTV